MRKSTLLLAIVFALLFACEEEKSHETDPLVCQQTTYGGCFQDASIKIYNVLQNDTLYIETDGDYLKLVTVLNYNCCGNLEDEYEIVNDSTVNVYITDACIEDCLCNCNCSFVFNYYFSEYREKKIRFSIFLKGYQENEFALWKTINYSGK